MNKLNKTIKSPKAYLNPTSHFPPLTSNKGITLISLIIYIAVVFVVLAAIMRITMYFSSNIKDATDVSFETEFNKLNLYLLDESKKTGNEILEITDGIQITFSSGNKYTYNEEEQKVYLNDNIKVCENVESCLFEQKVAENGKKVLTLTITIASIEKEINYIMVTQSNNYEDQDIIAEDDYIIEKDPFKDSYQQVEYIESTGTQYIDTGFIPNSNTSIEMKASNSSTSNACLYCARGSLGYTDNTYTAFLIGGTSLGVDYYDTQYAGIMTATKDMVYVYKQYKNLVYVNGELVKTLTESEFSSEYDMYLMASHQGGSSLGNIGNVKLYYCKIWAGETLVRDLVPCYRKSDNVVGMYDLVNGVFYTNAGTGEFIKGADV